MVNEREIEERLTAKADRLPSLPGVYIFRDRAGKIIYIGKAKSLRSRVRSYFQRSGREDFKSAYLRHNAADLEYVLTDTEVEALILESTLVKKNQPKLNVRLKDDKSFLHIKLTVNEAFPRVLLTRRIRNDGALYFGPYLPASLARNTIKVINRHFLLRTCRIEIDGKLDRPCLEYYIHRCLGPCVEGLCSKEEYRQAVQDVILLLEGRNENLVNKLTQKMVEASEEERFEAAALFRDRIQLVRDLAEKQKMASSSGSNIDVFGYFREGPRLALQLFTMRSGRVVGKREFFWEDLEYFDPPNFLRDALQQYYLHAGFLPDQIYLPGPIEDRETIAEWLSERKKRTSRRKVRLLSPQRGEKLDLVSLVERNAKIAFDSRFRVLKSSKTKLLENLREVLGLSKIPRRIEAFDISNIQSAEPVASMVVCIDGIMTNREYRKFKIKTVKAPNDFAAMQEVISRRYTRLLAEDAPLPDLILIDGGKGQLQSGLQALSELGIEDTPVASIAKREELLFVPHKLEPIQLSLSSPTLHLIQEIRDEAHRFAVTYHRKRRSIRDFKSELDEIPGIGEKRKKRLLQAFGSVARIRRAGEEELIPFVGKKLAHQIHQRFKKGPGAE